MKFKPSSIVLHQRVPNTVSTASNSSGLNPSILFGLLWSSRHRSPSQQRKSLILFGLATIISERRRQQTTVYRHEYVRDVLIRTKSQTLCCTDHSGDALCPRVWACEFSNTSDLGTDTGKYCTQTLMPHVSARAPLNRTNRQIPSDRLRTKIFVP